MTTRIPLNQTEWWHKHRSKSAYALDHCCHCGREVRPDAVRLRIVRTNDGRWWVKPVGEPPLPDERDFAEAVLPVGPGCYAEHPEWQCARIEQ